MTVVAESEALHERVRSFVRASMAGHRTEDFDPLAVAIAEHQARFIPGFRRLVAAYRPGGFGDASSIPAVPVDAFRLTRVATHPPELDCLRFSTSGTTGASPGVHAMRTPETYREISLAWGRRALASVPSGPRTVVALAPPPGEAPTSSLGFMLRAFMEELDGRSLEEGARPGAEERGRWLAGPDGVDVAGLALAARVASERGEPLLVLATGFALVLLLDALGSETMEVPRDTVVMPTGGTKGRTRDVAPADLVRDVARAFAISEAQVVGEYGMTELTTQLYEGTLINGLLRAPRGVYLPPPWLRVTPVDPATLEPVADGETGIARFVDLGNVDSAVAVVTQDLVTAAGPGVELCGRRPGAPPRGCSLAVEEMVVGARA